MIELQPEFKPFFYLSSICLGTEVAFLIAFLITPIEGWLMYAAFIALAASIPLLAAACTAAMVGYMKPLRYLLSAGLLLFLIWLTLLFMSFSVVASLVFLFVSLVSYKMLQYHHQDQKQQQN